MWIAKRKWVLQEKRIDDLEKKVQDQNEILHSHMLKHETENAELKEIIDSFEKEIIKECNTHYRTNVQDL